jgi:hypothetical protein
LGWDSFERMASLGSLGLSTSREELDRLLENRGQEWRKLAQLEQRNNRVSREVFFCLGSQCHESSVVVREEGKVAENSHVESILTEFGPRSSTSSFTQSDRKPVAICRILAGRDG